jgi:hypothetical protein
MAHRSKPIVVLSKHLVPTACGRVVHQPHRVLDVVGDAHQPADAWSPPDTSLSTPSHSLLGVQRHQTHRPLLVFLLHSGVHATTPDYDDTQQTQQRSDTTKIRHNKDQTQQRSDTTKIRHNKDQTQQRSDTTKIRHNEDQTQHRSDTTKIKDRLSCRVTAHAKHRFSCPPLALQASTTA